jgi:transcription elongation factor GreA
MTLKGFQKLQEELRKLKAERPQIVEAISAARSLGDLSENAEYHSAKERQGIVEARIMDLEDKLSRATVIDISKINSDTIRFGATVEIVDQNTNVVSKFQIVGNSEADVKSGLLPITAPMAKALIGKTIDDIVEVNAPGGIKSYKIVGVKYI